MSVIYLKIDQHTMAAQLQNTLTSSKVATTGYHCQLQNSPETHSIINNNFQTYELPKPFVKSYVTLNIRKSRAGQSQVFQPTYHAWLLTNMTEMVTLEQSNEPCTQLREWYTWAHCRCPEKSRVFGTLQPRPVPHLRKGNRAQPQSMYTVGCRHYQTYQSNQFGTPHLGLVSDLRKGTETPPQSMHQQVSRNYQTIIAQVSRVTHSRFSP